MVKASVLNRKLHRWGSIAVALPFALVLVTGLLLQLKKQLDWVQPPTARGTGGPPALGFDRVLAIASGVPEAGIEGWHDVDRLDVRPGRGVVKVRSRSRWEVQIDTATGEVLQVAYRRSDLIESLHDGSFFHEAVKLGVFFPAGLVVLGLWGTGLYLFFLPILARRRRRRPDGERP